MSNSNIVEIIQNASIDAKSLEDFLYKPYNYYVERRLAPPVHTLEYYIDYLDNIPTLVDERVSEVVLGRYKTDLEQRLERLEQRVSELEGGNASP